MSGAGPSEAAPGGTGRPLAAILAERLDLVGEIARLNAVQLRNRQRAGGAEIALACCRDVAAGAGAAGTGAALAAAEAELQATLADLAALECRLAVLDERVAALDRELAAA